MLAPLANSFTNSSLAATAVNKQQSSQQPLSKPQNHEQVGKVNEQAEPLTDQQLQQIQQLKNTDRAVRAHEAAHAGVGGQHAGAPKLSYTSGPDGKRYAVAGEVSINTSPVAGNPQATIAKMQQVQRAALAPADPSAQDLKVAALAGQRANQARLELNIQVNQERQQASEDVSKEDPQQVLSVRINDSGALDLGEAQSSFSAQA